VPSISSKKTIRSSSSASKRSTSTITSSAKERRSDTQQFLNQLAGKLTFAKVIGSTRLSDELSQQDFAAKLGISKQHLCDIEKGRKTVTPARAWAWAKKLGYHPQQWAELALQDLIDKEGPKSVTVRLDVA
jgi:DNA-binding transcriptional regulator YiaG